MAARLGTNRRGKGNSRVSFVVIMERLKDDSLTSNRNLRTMGHKNDERNAVSGRASARPDINVKKSEGDSPRKLNHARQIVLAAHLAYSAAPAGRRIKLRSVEQVEEFTSELEAESTIRTELRVLERGEVKVLLSVVAYVGLGTRIGSITEVIGGTGGEYRGVVPLVQFLVFGTAHQVRTGGSCRPGAAWILKARIAESSGAATDD